MTDLSIIVIEYNCLSEIRLFIDNIKDKCAGMNYEIIISSNSMYDIQKQEEIKNLYKEGLWLFNKSNGGFAYGMNEGLKVAKGDLIAISNPDVRLMTGLEDLLSFIRKYPQIGAIGPCIVDKEGIIQDSCRKYLTLAGFVNRNIKRVFFKKDLLNNDKIDYSSIQTVDWLIGAFILIKREVYDKTKGLDPGYFLYCEDLDWCTRIRQNGYEVVYYPKVRIEYTGSRTARKSFKYMRIFIKSIFKYWNKFGYFSIYPERENIFFEEDL